MAKDEDFTELELALTEEVTGTRPVVRNDCAFCGRERSAKDDNHAPECAYWTFFGPREG
jgi:hypothetical protein